MTTIRVALPSHLQSLAGVAHEVRIDVPDGATIQDLLDALEMAYPALRGTIRDQVTGTRRPFMRYHACGEDLSYQLPRERLPDAVVDGSGPFAIVGAISGG